MSQLDILPTVLEAAGILSPSGRTSNGTSIPFDGKSLLPLLIEQEASSLQHHHALYWANGFAPSHGSCEWAIRRGKYKIHGGCVNGDWSRPSNDLYDLENDPSETKNLAQSMPDVVHELTELHVAWRAEIRRAEDAAEKEADDMTLSARQALANYAQSASFSKKPCPGRPGWIKKYRHVTERSSRAFRVILHHIDTHCDDCNLPWCDVFALQARDTHTLQKMVSRAHVGTPLSKLGCENINVQRWPWTSAYTAGDKMVYAVEFLGKMSSLVIIGDAI